MFGFTPYYMVNSPIAAEAFSSMGKWQKQPHMGFITLKIGERYIGPQVSLYEGMIIGEISRPGDLDINVCRKNM